MSDPKYTPLVKSLPASVPFVGPEQQERARGAVFRARLGANENLFGPSPEAIEAMRRETSEIWKYADPTAHDLQEAIAAHHGVSPANIMIGEGIDGLLGNLVRLLIGPGDAVVTSDGAYPTFNYHVSGFGGVLHKVPYASDHEDLPALMAHAAETGSKLVYFANPDNPMGTWHRAEVIEAALDQIPDGCLLILDEAYIEFAPEGTAPKIAADDPRVIRMRTFSKAYGMAGARIGYAMGAPGLIESFNKIRNHFGVNRVAQAGALAALADDDWLNQTCRAVAASRARLEAIAKTNGLSTLPSATNFVAIDCGHDGDFARTILADLVAGGMFVRMPFVAPQDRCIRVSCGPDNNIDAFADSLAQTLQKLGG